MVRIRARSSTLATHVAELCNTVRLTTNTSSDKHDASKDLNVDETIRTRLSQAETNRLRERIRECQREDRERYSCTSNVRISCFTSPF